jgi:hypothetical protein
MPDSSDIDSALVAKLQADVALTTLMPDGVFMDEAGKSIVTGGNSTRFVIVSLVDERDEDVFGGTAFEDALYLVKAVELKPPTGSGNIKAAAARIQVVLHDQVLTVAGYTPMAMHRESRIRLLEVDDVDATIRWMHRGGHYRVQQAVS